jgi:hypothetical protein
MPISKSGKPMSYVKTKRKKDSSDSKKKKPMKKRSGGGGRATKGKRWS